MPSPFAALVQTRFEPIDPEVLEGTLARLTKLPRVEIIRIARRERGILSEQLPAAVCQQVAESLLAENIGVTSVPIEELPQLGKPRNALWIEPGEQGFGVPLDHRQVLEPIAWLSVFAIHAELMADKHATQEQTAANAIRERGLVANLAKTRVNQRFPNVDVVAIGDSGKLVYFRIAQARFAPGRMPWIPAEQPLAEKFYHLLRVLVERSTAAVVSPEARKLLFNRTSSEHVLAELGVDDRDERATANYMRWLLWLAMHRERVAAE
jgi:hypothetical protein